jgi:hypothetical protein
MSVTSSAPSAAKASSSSSLASSAKFRTFAIVFGVSAPIVYTISEILALPLFTFHPATYRFEWGWAPGRSGEGPAMYWYGWVAGMLVACTVLGWLATFVPERFIQKIPLALLWLLPILAIFPLVWALMPFWTKG